MLITNFIPLIYNCFIPKILTLKYPHIMENLKFKKLMTIILTGSILLFNSCEDFTENEILLSDPASGEELVSWIDLLNQIDLESEVAFVQNSQSIQDAIDAALPGDKIYIEPGTYQGNLTNNKSDVQLIGLSVKPNDLVINNSKENNIDILKLYDQKSVDGFQKNSQKKGTNGLLSDFSRTELSDGIVHYQFKVRVGPGEFDKIGVHRLVKEIRTYWPIQTEGHVFMVHGALAGFGNTFFAPGLESSDDINENTSAPFNLALKNIDVWGIDLGWTMVPAETTDFNFFDGWGFEKDAYHTMIGMLIARFGRGFSGQGFSPINLLGYSSGATVAYALANRETQQPNLMKRHIKGLIPVDNAFKFENGEDIGCGSAGGFMDEINSGKLQNEFGAFFSWAGGMAIATPDDDSPIIPGVSNSQALRILFSSPQDPENGVFFHFFGGNMNEFFYSDESRIFNVAASYSPYMPNQIWYEFNALNCSSEDVSFDDYLNLISVPIYYIGAGGDGKAGFYTGTLTASTDITNHFVSVNGDPATDFGHVDTWLGYDANQLLWAELGNWIINHR
jgi:pimeloyl-ACP methyl ester carboxylesterase